MSAPKKKFVVVGAGQSGSAFIKRIQKFGDDLGIELTAIVEPDKKKSGALAADFPEAQRPELCSNIGSLSRLEDAKRPEAAIICVPAQVHVESSTACLHKGLHCLVEKPMGYSAVGCRELDKVAQSNKRHIQGAFLDRWLLAELWNSWKPTAGVWTVNAIRTGPFVPRAADTDVVHDMMIRDIDIFLMLHKIFSLSPIRDIRSWGRKLRSDNLDYAVAALELEDGSLMRFFSSRLSSETLRGWQLTGPDWHANLNFLRKSLKRFEKAGKDTQLFKAVETKLDAADPVTHELAAFSKTIDEKVPFLPSPHFDLENFDSLRAFPHNLVKTHELVDQIMSSMRMLDS